MTTPPKIVLITGTTSGIGRALLKYYQQTNVRIITIDRRKMSDELYEGVDAYIMDITSRHEVSELLNELSILDAIPDVFILNAGINRTDNVSSLNYETFREVIHTNLMGVMTFVSEIQSQEFKNRTVLAISSTSNIVANPGNLGYHLSKRDLHRAFQIFSKTNPENHYKSVILGPVHTNISTGLPPLEGLNKRIFEMLAVSAIQASKAIAKFIENDDSTLRYPRFAIVFYWVARAVLVFFPSIYSGNESPKVNHTS